MCSSKLIFVTYLQLVTSDLEQQWGGINQLVDAHFKLSSISTFANSDLCLPFSSTTPSAPSGVWQESNSLPLGVCGRRRDSGKKMWGEATSRCSTPTVGSWTSSTTPSVVSGQMVVRPPWPPFPLTANLLPSLRSSLDSQLMPDPEHPINTKSQFLVLDFNLHQLEH